MFSKALALLAALALAACARPTEVRPALWLVEGPGGQQAWLFGTIHALPQPVDWRSPAIEQALAGSDRLVLEVARIDDDAGTARVFAGLAQSPGLPPLAQRVPAGERDELAEAMAADGLKPGALDGYETWAAALLLQQALTKAGASDSGNGIDRALLRGYTKPVEEFEGAAAQLAIFDRLPEAAQRSLLSAALTDPKEAARELDRLAQAWAKADLDLIDRETNQEFLSDPVLREALLTDRNRAWDARLTAMLRAGAHPFVAVGTAHLVGKDGLPERLAAQGYKVTRLQ